MGDFAFTVSEKAIPKMIQNGFTDTTEYIGQLIMRFYEYGATNVKINITPDYLALESDCQLPQEEYDLVKKVQTDYRAIPYSMAFQNYRRLTLSGSSTTITMRDNGRDSFDIKEFENESYSNTSIALSQRRKPESQKEEEQYCLENLIDSDLDITLNDNQITLSNPHVFNKKGIKGSILLKNGQNAEHFYYKGRKIISRPLTIGLEIVVHKHPFEPVFSLNDIKFDTKTEENYIDVRNQVINEFIQTHLNNQVLLNILDEMVLYDLESEKSILNENTMRAIRDTRIIYTSSDECLSFNQLFNKDVYVNRQGFWRLIKDYNNPPILLNSFYASLFKAMGGTVREPIESPIYNSLSQLRDLPKISIRQILRDPKHDTIQLQTSKYPGEISTIILHSQTQVLDEFLSNYMIEIFPIYTQQNSIETPITYENGSYIINMNSPTIQFYLSSSQKNKIGLLPLIYEILSHHYSIPENQVFGGERKNPDAIVDHIIGNYLSN